MNQGDNRTKITRHRIAIQYLDSGIGCLHARHCSPLRLNLVVYPHKRPVTHKPASPRSLHPRKHPAHTYTHIAQKHKGTHRHTQAQTQHKNTGTRTTAHPFTHTNYGHALPSIALHQHAPYRTGDTQQRQKERSKGMHKQNNKSSTTPQQDEPLSCPTGHQG